MYGLDPVVLRDQLFMLWSQKDLQTLHLAALQGFSKLSEPLEALLTILEGCPGRQKGRSHTLGHHVLFEFQTWMKELPQVTLSSLSEQQALALQRRALNLLIDTQASFVDGLINIYLLNSLDPAILAAVLSVKLKLQKDLNMEEMCVPLILQNKLPLAESFVTGHNHLEQQLVTLLDSWCHAYFSVDEIRRRYPRLSLTKQSMSQIQPKLLAKHVFRLVEKFNIDQGLCPNALHKRRLDSLRFLMYKTFVEKGMTEEIWCDHVQYVVADDLELRISLVELLVRYSDIQKAAQWALRYNIPRNRLPCGVWETQQDLPPDLQHIGGSAQTEDWIPSQSHCQKFYQVPLTKDKVHFVDSPEALQRCRNIVLKEGGVVGVDMEWQPTFGCISTQRVALIQLAALDQIQHQKINRTQNGPKEVLVGEGSSEKGLSLLVQQVLKKPLDKTEQMSNWEKRPLRISQIRYADACCLLEVYSVLSSNPDQFGIPSDLRSIMSSQSEKRGDKKKKEECQGAQRVSPPRSDTEKGLLCGEKPSEDAPPLPPQHLRVVCDNMLQGLGRYLRCLGVDVIMLENTDDHRVAAKLRSQVGEGRCLSLDCAKRPENRPLESSDTSMCSSSPATSSAAASAAVPMVIAAEIASGGVRVVVGLTESGGDSVALFEEIGDSVAVEEAGEISCFHPSSKPHCPVSSIVNGPFQSAAFLSCLAQSGPSYLASGDREKKSTWRWREKKEACNSDQYAAVPRKDMVRMLKQKGQNNLPGFLQDDSDHTHQQEEGKLDDFPTPELDPDTLTFPGGAPIQLHTVPPALLPRISLFYVCTRCGKVFWEGTHYGRVLSMFQDILHIEDTEAEAQQH
ncbi:hypothetical protein F7725_015434 [Dissostichus mawsoni]|uniref:Exonuclease mut-7 homolog n=1 Tax=Dissostichus mawsoni TaxID=36200 RepID=A0A7J5YKC5_DISMA|nr:hypothetical protein F7725_015434 [Dissostichus mawsoni]